MRAYFVYVPLFEVMDRRKRSAEGRRQAVRCCLTQKRSPDYVFCIGACSLWQAPADRGDLSAPFSDDPFHQRDEKILADVDGVGKVKVMLSIRNSTEKVLAKDETYSESEKKEASDGSSNQTNDTQNISTHIFYDTSDGSRPYVVMENMPVIDGAIIVCEGGDNKELVNDITNAVYGLLNVPVHKIKVMKMS